jgi:Rrf2 family protein
MRLQKNTMLALNSVIEFAGDPARHISTAEIAARHRVSVHHLAKVLSELARAGVVESVRGVGGGYRFAGNIRRLTLMDVIQLFEDFSPRPAAHEQPARGRHALHEIQPMQAMDKALGAVLTEIDEIARSTFSSITFATMLRLVERQQRGAGAPAPRQPSPASTAATARSRRPPAGR